MTTLLEDQAPRIVRAPWTHEQVCRLNDYQQAGMMHPYTCGVDSDHLLVATTTGWVCSQAECTYTQDWALTALAEFERSDWVTPIGPDPDGNYWRVQALELARDLDQAEATLRIVSGTLLSAVNVLAALEGR